MTEQTAVQAGSKAEQNGAGGLAAVEPGVPGSDRALGIVVAAVGLFVILAGIDRFTGGLISRTVTAFFAPGEPDES